MLRYGFHVIAGGTSLVHFLVGVDRYRRVCRSTNIQMSVRSAKLSSFLVSVISVLVVLPVPVMYDITPAETRIQNITGCRCDIATRYSDTVVPLIFHGMLSVFAMTMAVILVILYSLIGRKICRQINIFKNMDTMKDNGARRLDDANETGNNRVGPMAQTHVEQSVAGSVAIDHNQDSESESVVQGVNKEAPAIRVQSSYIRQRRSRETLSRKLTFITFAIMIVYIVSFFPLEVLVLVTQLDRDIEAKMTFTQEVLYRMGYHTYVLNNVANPLVYLFMDVEFRKHCRDMIANIV